MQIAKGSVAIRSVGADPFFPGFGGIEDPPDLHVSKRRKCEWHSACNCPHMRPYPGCDLKVLERSAEPSCTDPKLSYGWLPDSLSEAIGECSTLAGCLRAIAGKSSDPALTCALFDRAEDLRWIANDLAGGAERRPPYDAEATAPWLTHLLAPILQKSPRDCSESLGDFAIATRTIRALAHTENLLSQIQWVAHRLELVALSSELELHLQRWGSAVQEFNYIAARLFNTCEGRRHDGKGSVPSAPVAPLQAACL